MTVIAPRQHADPARPRQNTRIDDRVSASSRRLRRRSIMRTAAAAFKTAPNALMAANVAAAGFPGAGTIPVKGRNCPNNVSTDMKAVTAHVTNRVVSALSRSLANTIVAVISETIVKYAKSERIVAPRSMLIWPVRGSLRATEAVGQIELANRLSGATCRTIQATGNRMEGKIGRSRRTVMLRSS